MGFKPSARITTLFFSFATDCSHHGSSGHRTDGVARVTRRTLAPIRTGLLDPPSSHLKPLLVPPPRAFSSSEIFKKSTSHRKHRTQAFLLLPQSRHATT